MEEMGASRLMRWAETEARSAQCSSWTKPIKASLFSGRAMAETDLPQAETAGPCLKSRLPRRSPRSGLGTLEIRLQETVGA